MTKWAPATGPLLLALATADAAWAQLPLCLAPLEVGCAGPGTPVGGSAPPPLLEGSQPTPATPSPAPDRNPRKKLFESEDGTLNMLNRVQFRWTQEWPDENERLSGTDGPGVGKGAFRIRRAKTELTGWLFRPELTYELQLSWAGPEAGASTQTPLEDFYVTWDVSKKQAFKITLGQFKVPLGRQEMTSSGNLQFADRDILSFEFTRGRDIGVQLEGVLRGGKLAYQAGVFNGNPASRLGNDNTKYQYNARVTFQPRGTVRYSEGDFESRDKPLFAVGAQFEHNDQRGASSEAVNDLKSVIWGADAVFKYKGFSLFAEIFLRDREPETGPSFRSDGWHAQAGYFLKRDKIEIAARYARFDPDPAPGDDQKEVGGALNYFIRKHTLKVQADFRQLENGTSNTKNKELRIQTQVMF
jgi:phosphate-selective porin OprO and OprP